MIVLENISEFQNSFATDVAKLFFNIRNFYIEFLCRWEGSMTKKEFLDILADALSGNIPMSEVNENIKYYRDYIENGESSEEEALKKLGDPHLIARTIIESFKASKGSMADYYTKQARDEYSRTSSGKSYESYNNENSYENVSGNKSGFGFFSNLTWYEKLIGVLGIIIILAVLFVIGTVATAILIRVVIPIVLILIVIKIIMDFIRRG